MTRQSITHLLALGTLVIIGTACSNIALNLQGDSLKGANKGEVLATVNGTELHSGYVDILTKVNPRIKAQLSSPQGMQRLVDNLVEQELMYQASVKAGLDKDPDVLEKAALYKRMIISQALLDQQLDKEVKEYYEKNKEGQFTKVKISQIEIDFVSDEAPKAVEPKAPVKTAVKKGAKPLPPQKPEHVDTAVSQPIEGPTPEQKAAALKKAEAVRARLVAGEDFAKIADELSDDKLTRKKGGDLGEVSRDDKRLQRMDLNILAETAFTLKNGDISQPIESKKGYHIIQVTSEPVVTSLEEADKNIRFQIQQDSKNKLLASLKEKAQINIKKDEASAPSAMPAPSLSDSPAPTPVAPAPAPQTAPAAPTAPEKAPQEAAPAAQ